MVKGALCGSAEVCTTSVESEAAPSWQGSAAWEAPRFLPDPASSCQRNMGDISDAQILLYSAPFLLVPLGGWATAVLSFPYAVQIGKVPRGHSLLRPPSPLGMCGGAALEGGE